MIFLQPFLKVFRYVFITEYIYWFESYIGDKNRLTICKYRILLFFVKSFWRGELSSNDCTWTFYNTFKLRTSNVSVLQTLEVKYFLAKYFAHETCVERITVWLAIILNIFQCTCSGFPIRLDRKQKKLFHWKKNLMKRFTHSTTALKFIKMIFIRKAKAYDRLRQKHNSFFL